MKIHLKNIRNMNPKTTRGMTSERGNRKNLSPINFKLEIVSEKKNI